ncbi:MAG: PHP domain-containing protein [PVC group bacterium]
MFSHLHCHFLGSYSDSLLDPARDLDYIREMGQEAAAITDHGVLDYCYPFDRACRRAGLHPVIGCEVYFVDDAQRSIETGDPYRNHLILLARDNGGFQNLVRLVNQSWIENNFGETRGLVDWKLLEKYHEGLIALSGCFWGSVPQKYITGGLEEAEKEFQRYFDLFGRDFYPELGRHGIPDEEKANEGLIALSRRFGAAPVVTNDAHYARPGDWEFHDIIIKTRFGYPTDFALDVRTYYLKTEDEMRALGFPPEYYDASVEISRRCRVDLDELAPALVAGPVRPKDTVVFSPRQVLIDAARAIRDVAGAWKVFPGTVEEILRDIPAGMTVPAACREYPALRRWLDEHPQVREAAERIQGIPRQSLPDFDTIIPVPLDRLGDSIPLKRSRGEIMAAYPEPVLKSLGVPLAPSAALEELGGRVRTLKTREEARGKMEQKEYASAAILLEGILRGHPDDLEARYLLAETLFSLREFERAIPEYEILEKCNYSPSRRPGLLTRLGWAYNWLEQTAQAEDSFARALKLNPRYGPALYALGVITGRRGEKERSLNALDRFLALNPEGRKAEKARLLAGRLRRAGGREK